MSMLYCMTDSDEPIIRTKTPLMILPRSDPRRNSRNSPVMPPKPGR